jgi:hypothetical protein
MHALTDEELAEWLCIKDITGWQRIINKLTPKERDAYERLFEVVQELKSGKKPKGVIVLEDRES